ncbi:glycoside hydrolase family 88 protein [Paenibacillus sp. FSL H7-0331]|uniref:glycoside hydrolase family 88 protein n=1 Tax=Paenibacillus sp. FSL H7-0331 TaxID=1920421 RepID=UPI00096C3233|nr:glycoside hydrolase family 88 protein [Paenibacillus sp. FSL H7-0331]OMF16326.1 hypothetical protein BK127_12950 [Paenibacillus sp. FSL H7-0331]
MSSESPDYYRARIIDAPDRLLPEGKRLPHGWSAVPVVNEPLQLEWPDTGDYIARKLPAPSRLRITVALDYRDAKLIEVFLPETGSVLGHIDIRYAYVFQPFELALTAEQTEAVLRQGVGIRVDEGEWPLWIFDALEGDISRKLYAPHLLIGDDQQSMKHYLDSVSSLSSLQPFGWLEGCVLDGIYAMRNVLGAQRIDQVIEAHLGQFLDSEGNLHYEDLHGRKADGSFTTIEATLPLAVIVKVWPDHSIVTGALEFWSSRGTDTAAGGLVIDGDAVTAEGAYTVAYPLAAIASRLNRQDLAEQAIQQLLLRRDCLADGNHIYLRYFQQSQTHTFRSWSRAFAWYMLGMTQTWIELKTSRYASLPGVNEIEEELRRVAQAALSWRQPEGLWTCFLDEPQTGIETSGSAGIAAAIALCAKHGLLQESYAVVAAESLNVLAAYLTPDGILSGVAQHNAGGLELQRGGYRVLSQMGMGLMAQLYAAIHSDAGLSALGSRLSDDIGVRDYE